MPKKTNPNSAGYTNALLEDINDKFQAVLEATQPIPAMSRRLDATFEEVGQLRVDIKDVGSASNISKLLLKRARQEINFFKVIKSGSEVAT